MKTNFEKYAAVALIFMFFGIAMNGAGQPYAAGHYSELLPIGSLLMTAIPSLLSYLAGRKDERLYLPL